jgi:hypothetical protein
MGDLFGMHIICGICEVCLSSILVSAALTLVMCITASRRFAIASALISAAQIAWWLHVADYNHGAPYLLVWSATLMLVALWRVFHRPRALYVPPPEPLRPSSPYR